MMYSDNCVDNNSGLRARVLCIVKFYGRASHLHLSLRLWINRIAPLDRVERYSNSCPFCSKFA